MGRLRPSHLVEAGLWLLGCAVLYGLTFKFNQTIEIYKFGASAWPRALILLIVLAVIGQLAWQYRYGDSSQSETAEKSSDSFTVTDSEHSNVAWYALTAVLIALPFVYMRVPELVGQMLSLPQEGLGPAKLVTAAIVVAVFIFLARNNKVGGMLSLPLMFAAFLEDFGFYSMAPFFILGVMWLMGERRKQPMFIIMLVLFALLLLLFVKVLYVGLPTGNIEPFYTIGTTVVNILQ